MSIRSSPIRFLSHIFSPRPFASRNFNVLAIESSADDTCAAVVHSSRKILSNVVIKQHDMFVTPSTFFSKPAKMTLCHLDTSNMVEYNQLRLFMNINAIWSVCENVHCTLLTFRQPFAVKRALTEAGLDLVRDIDGIAFTRGPGALPPLVYAPTG